MFCLINKITEILMHPIIGTYLKDLIENLFFKSGGTTFG